MRRFVLLAIILMALLYAVGVAAIASLPAWKYLPDLPVVVTAASCPAAPVALAADQDRVIALVLAYEFERGEESAGSRESCNRITKHVRANAPSFYAFVPQRFICRSVRAHAHKLWLEADLWPGPDLWILDGEITGAGRVGFVEALRGAGLRYTRVDETHVEIQPLD
jgi:hypothetical protein